LRASPGVARIYQTTASASGAKGTPTYGITAAGFQPRGHSEPTRTSSQAIGDTCAILMPLWQRGCQRKYKKRHWSRSIVGIGERPKNQVPLAFSRLASRAFNKPCRIRVFQLSRSTLAPCILQQPFEKSRSRRNMWHNSISRDPDMHAYARCIKVQSI
jgi:hypothetical protein